MFNVDTWERTWYNNTVLIVPCDGKTHFSIFSRQKLKVAPFGFFFVQKSIAITKRTCYTFYEKEVTNVPKLDSTISIRLPSELKKAIKREADKRYQTTNAFMVACLLGKIKELEERK